MKEGNWRRTFRSIGRSLIIAHRGASELATENSLEAILLARQLGVDGVEIDVRFTKDGRAICFHDEDLTRIASTGERVAELTFETLKSLYPAVLVLEEALQFSDSLPFLLDIKEKEPGKTLAIAEIVARSKAPENCLATIRDLEIARLLAGEHPEIGQICMLRDDDGVIGFIASATKRSWIRISEPHLRNETIDRVRRAGMSLAVVVGGLDLETVGKIDAPRLGEVLRWKPDAVVLDDVAMATALFAQAASPAR